MKDGRQQGQNGLRDEEIQERAESGEYDGGGARRMIQAGILHPAAVRLPRRPSSAEDQEMTKLLAALLLLALPALPQAPSARVAAVLNDWHQAAAAADESRYFAHFAPKECLWGPTLRNDGR